jgi:hypothetical protein
MGVCDRLQFNSRTATIAPRYHLKSTLAEAFIAWQIFRMQYPYNEWQYMSYTTELGAYHTKNIKRFIEVLPELFGDFEDLTDSESILSYKNDKGKFFCDPNGILTFKRGKHPHGIILDDILKDPTSRLDLSQIQKITDAFLMEVEPMPKDFLHIVGTQQDESDLFSVLQDKKGFDVKRYDSIVDEVKHKTWWEGMWSWDKLMSKKALMGEKAFNQEFRCRPVRSSDNYISYSAYNSIECKRLKNYEMNNPPKLKGKTIVVGGMDIGKKTHPSHVFILAMRDEMIYQVHSKFMDGWDYEKQIEYCREVIRTFGVQKLFYDDTRSEFELSKEKGELPAEMEGIPFTSRTKFAMATELDRIVSSRKIRLLEDHRQRRQILSVDSDLNAPVTSEGHGDAFFSLCLAVHALTEATGIFVWSPN